VACEAEATPTTTSKAHSSSASFFMGLRTPWLQAGRTCAARRVPGQQLGCQELRPAGVFA
jgi:hypothetical protein